MKRPLRSGLALSTVFLVSAACSSSEGGPPSALGGTPSGGAPTATGGASAGTRGGVAGAAPAGGVGNAGAPAGGAPGTGGAAGAAGMSSSGGGAGGSGGTPPSLSGAAGMSGTSGGNAGRGGAAGGGPSGSGGTGGGAGANAGGGPNAGSAGGPDLSSVASVLNSSAGFKMVAPCGAIGSTQRSCDHDPRSNCGSGLGTFLRTDETLGGSKGTFYDIKLHFRGILEMNQYAGGTSDHNGFYTGGQTNHANGLDGGDQYNQYVLEVSSPHTVYHLNHLDQDQRDKYRMGVANSSGVHHFGFLMDYQETIRIEGGAMVSLYMLDNDCLFGRNCEPPSDDFGHCELQTLPDVPGIQQPFDGNFIWIDVESVTLAP